MKKALLLTTLTLCTAAGNRVMHFLFPAALLLLLSAAASAQGMLGTSKSFSTSPFCQSYKCTSEGNTDGNGRKTNTWSYKTRFNDTIFIARESRDPASKVISGLLMVWDADIKYWPEDSKTFNALQTQLMGKPYVTLPEECYAISGDIQQIKELSIRGTTYRIFCGGGGGIMSVGITIKP